MSSDGSVQLYLTMLDSEVHTRMKTCTDRNGAKTCPDCNGDGVVDKDTDDERQCLTRGGLGFVPDDDNDLEEIIRAVCICGAALGWISGVCMLSPRRLERYPTPI